MGSFRAANKEEELAFIEHCKEWIRKNPNENKYFESQFTYLHGSTRERRGFLAEYRAKSSFSF